MPNTQDYNNLTEEQKKAIDEAMAASNPNETTELKEEILRQIKQEYKGPLIDIIKTIDKSAYVEVLDNDKTSADILNFLEIEGTLKRLAYQDQINHYEKMFADHRSQSAQRQEIIKKSETQGMAALTEEERKIMVSSTQLETLLQGATKSFFATKRADCLEKFNREMQTYARRVQNNPEAANIETFKRSFDYTRNNFGATMLWDKATHTQKRVELYKFRDGDVPKYLYDDAEYDRVLKNYDTYLRTHIKEIEKDIQLREYGRDMDDKGAEFVTLSQRYEDTFRITQEEYEARHDKAEKAYLEAKQKYEQYDKQLKEDPNYKSYLSSPEYACVLNDQYYNGKYDGKIFENLPDVEKAIYVAHKYDHITGMGLHKIPAEERAFFDKGVMIQAMPRVLEMEANLDNVEKTMSKVWNETRNAAEQPFQKKELEENRAILSAYKKYLTDGSKESQKKFYEEINKAYDNAKQNFKDNPDMRARFEVRADQLSKGDFTFVPMLSRRDAKHYGMTANWDKHTYTREELDNLKNLPKTNAEKQYERAFSVHVTPLDRKALDYEIERDAQNRPELTLKQMGQSLQGADLEDYKATIYNDKMEKFNEFADVLNAEIKTTKNILKSLSKQYGFFERLFSPHYKGRKLLLENDLDYGRKKYDIVLKKTKYDIYKTYQEKGLAFTKAEKKEFDAIVREATRNGKIKEWDGDRDKEKRKIEEYNKTFYGTEMEKPQETEKNVPTTTQLDLGAMLNNKKTVEQPIKEETVKENTIAKEQKTLEEKDIEI